MSKVMVCCGLECGIMAGGNAANANKHWYSITGTPTIETSIVRSGTRSVKFAAAATRPNLFCNVPASQTVAYLRAYFYTDDATPASQVCLFLVQNTTNAHDFVLRLKTTGVLEASWGNASPQSSAAMADNEWFGVEIEVDVSANPNVARWRVWRASTGWVSQTDSSDAQAADTITTDIGFRFGMTNGEGPTSAWNLYADDIVGAVGTTTGEFYSTSVPHGGAVLRYLPNADGAHSAFSSGDFKYDNSGSIVNTATDVWTYLDDTDQTSIADGFISQNVAGAGKYVRVKFADEVNRTDPRFVGITSTHHSSAGAADEMHLRVSDDGTNWTNVWGDWASAGLDTGLTTAFYLHKVLTTKPSGGAWTIAAINALEAEWGNSDDVTPPPFFDSVALEVDWGGLARSATDGVTQADAVVRAATNARDLTDATTQADVVTRLAALPRATTDGMTQADAGVRVIAALRATTDARAQADAVTRLGAFAHATTDALSQADVAARVVALPRSATDSLAQADVPARAVAATRTLTDARSQADVATRVAALPRTTTDALSQADALTRIVGYPRTVTDGLSRADSLARSVGTTRTITDGLAQSDVATRAALAFARTVADAMARSDAVVRHIDAFRNTADDVVVHATDALHLADAAVRSIAVARTTTDAVTAADALGRVVARLRTASDTLFPSDAAVRVAGFVRGATDALARADTPLRSSTMSRATTDALGQADDVSRAMTLARTAAQVLGMVDAATRTADATRTTVDGLTMVDIVDALRQGATAYFRTVSDGLTSADAVVRATTATRLITQAVTLLDNVTREADAIRVTGESLTTQDALDRQTDLLRDVQDMLVSTDLAIMHGLPTLGSITATVRSLSPIATVRSLSPVAEILEDA